MPVIVHAPPRAIIELPRNERGLFAQPDWSKMSVADQQAYARDMQHRRERAGHDAQFGDRFVLPHTNDPKGEYRCAGCNRQVDGACIAVDVKRNDLNHGNKSCDVYEIERVCDPEPDNRALTPLEAGFVEAELPWGCIRCSMQELSGFIDQIGRKLWCMRWAFTVEENNCCAKNDNPSIPLNPDGTRKDGSTGPLTRSSDRRSQRKSARVAQIRKAQASVKPTLKSRFAK